MRERKPYPNVSDEELDRRGEEALKRMLANPQKQPGQSSGHGNYGNGNSGGGNPGGGNPGGGNPGGGSNHRRRQRRRPK